MGFAFFLPNDLPSLLMPEELIHTSRRPVWDGNPQMGNRSSWTTFGAHRQGYIISPTQASDIRGATSAKQTDFLGLADLADLPGPDYLGS